MSEISIKGLLPNEIGIQVGDDRFTAYLDEGKDMKYVLKEQLDKGVETDNILIYIGDELFDSITKRVAVRAGDILHLEYNLHVGGE